MAQRKTGKHSSALQGLQDKTAQELIDLLSDPAAFTRYSNQYVEERAGEAEKQALADYVGLRRRLLCELANIKPGVDGLRWFQGRWGHTLGDLPAAPLAAMAEELRFVWRRPAIDLAEQVLNAWLAGEPLPAVPGERSRGTRAELPFACSLGAGRLVPDRANLRAMLVQGVFENWRHLQICANADCASPHFIARRKDQLVCDAEVCKAEKQRAHALKWWHEHRGAHVAATGTVRRGKKTGKARP